MKRILRTILTTAATAAGIAGLVLVAGCGEKKPTLHFYTWADYIKPELVERFEQENGCRVVIDTFDSNEAMLAKLKAGATGYDILVPSSYMVRILEQEGLIQPLDHSKIPNLQHVDKSYLQELAFDKEMRVSVPYMLAPTVFAYLADKVENVEPTWGVFDREDLKGRITLLNDMRETLGAALKFLGYSLNTRDEAQINEARDVVIRWKKNIAKFQSEQYAGGLASGEFVLCHGYSGDLSQAVEENENITLVLPREGTSISCDDLVLCKDAPAPELAYKFIDFLCNPEVAAENTEYIYYLAPNSSAYELMADEIKEDPTVFIDPAIRAKSEIIDDLGEEDNAKYIRAWDAVKAAQ